MSIAYTESDFKFRVLQLCEAINTILTKCIENGKN